MPYEYKTRYVGDLILADDWNTMAQEILRLGAAKVDREGDAISGALSIKGNVDVGSTNAGAALRVLKKQEDGSDPAGHGAVILGSDATSSASLRLGYNTTNAWIQTQGAQQALAINPQGGNVGLGTDKPKSRLSVAGGLGVGAGYAGTNAAPDNSVIVEGNVGIGTPAPQARLHVEGASRLNGNIDTSGLLSFGSMTRQMVNLWGTGYGIGVQNNTQYFRSDSNFAWYRAGTHSNNALDAGGGVALLSITGDNLGVGTAKPSHKLHVVADQAVGLFESTGENAFLRFTTKEGMDNRVEIANRKGGRLALWVGAGGDVLNITREGNLGVGTTTPGAKFEVNGTAVISNGTSSTSKNKNMAAGSLTIGSIDTNYGGGKNWNGNTAGLLLEALDSTEIAVHDAGTRVASLMYYEGGDSAHRITIGRDMGWGTIGQIAVNGVMTGPANDYEKAQFTMSGGGVVSWTGSGGRLRWTNRFIAISMGRPSTFAGGHINIMQPQSNIDAQYVYDGKARSATADGVVLGDWEALWAVHTPGGDQSAVSYRITRYTNDHTVPSNWLLVAVVNGDDKSIRLGTGQILLPNGWTNPLVQRMYPSNPVVYQDIFDARDAGVIKRIGNSAKYNETNHVSTLWFGRRIICYGGNSEPDTNGAQVTIPAGYDTVWVRVLGDRYTCFKALFLDGNKEDCGVWTGGFRSANGYCPDGSLSDGWNDPSHGIDGGSTSRVELHQWVPIPVRRSGSLALICVAGNWDFWVSGIAFSKNPWAHAALPALGYHWKHNSSPAAITWQTHDWHNDQLAQMPANAVSDLMVPVVPSGRDKLLYLIDHNNDWNGVGHTGITVNGKPIERFLATYDNPFARHWTGKFYERYIAARIPNGVIGDERFAKVSIDRRKNNDNIYFREIGTHDLEVPLPV